MPIDDPALADHKLLIVVGAHLKAEVDHRPIAYRLGVDLERRLAGVGATEPVLVCTDLWYLNDDGLRSLPTISIGSPDVNAFSAFLAGRLPSAFAIDGELVVQLDLERLDLVACCWGAGPEATEASVDAFCRRYADLFIDEAIKRFGR
jgi:hypothetical protein